MQLRRQLEGGSGEVIVAESALDRSPPWRIPGQLVGIKIERQQNLALRSLNGTGFGIHPIGNRMPCRNTDERWPVLPGAVRQERVHVRREPVRLSRVVE